MRILHSIALRLALACFFLSLSLPATAEGGSCPPGYYPVGGGPSRGCATLPSNTGTNGGGRSPVYEKRWGAIALNPTTGLYAIANQVDGKRQARKRALEQCGDGCEVQFTYYNQCAAMAQGRGPVAIATAASKREAESRALAQCATVSTDCAVHDSQCSVPVRVR